MSRRERILSALASVLDGRLHATVRRNEEPPSRLPDTGFVILHDGLPGEPEITLCPRMELYTHSIQLEVYMPRGNESGNEAKLDHLLTEIGEALRVDPTLGGLVGDMNVTAPELEIFSPEDGGPALVARTNIVVDYLVRDPLSH